VIRKKTFIARSTTGENHNCSLIKIDLLARPLGLYYFFNLNALQSCPVSSESSEGDGKDSKEDDDEKDLSTVSTSSIPSSHSTSSLSTWKSFPISCAVGDETAEEEAYEELCYITFNVKEVRAPLPFA
jgi:hypothetical protein